MRVAINRELTKRIETFRGLFQGSLLSRFLFLVFIHDLAETLSRESTQQWPNNLIFSDDFQLIGSDLRELQHSCDLVTFGRLRMEWKLQCSGISDFHTGLVVLTSKHIATRTG
jgi:hypothetical protein